MFKILLLYSLNRSGSFDNDYTWKPQTSENQYSLDKTHRNPNLPVQEELLQPVSSTDFSNPIFHKQKPIPRISLNPKMFLFLHFLPPFSASNLWIKFNIKFKMIHMWSKIKNIKNNPFIRTGKRMQISINQPIRPHINST